MITSLSNPKIKFLRKLRNKKHRDESQLFYIEGPRIVFEAFNEGWKFSQVFYNQEMISDNFTKELVNRLLVSDIDCYEVEKHIFESISIKDGPKGIAAILHQRTFNLDEISKNAGIWVGLDRIQDPGNLGSIIRTIDAIGGKGIILINNCTDPYDISSIRGSMGSIFSLRIIKSDSNTFINFVTKNKLTLIGTSDKAKTDYQSVNYDKETILLMGSEREGLSTSLLNACDKLISIPMIGKNDSLNVAIATSVCLYEIFNQNRKKNL